MPSEEGHLGSAPRGSGGDAGDRERRSIDRARATGGPTGGRRALVAPALAMPAPPRLLGSLRNALRVRRYSDRTVEAYVHWVRRYVRHHGLRHPRDLGAEHVT